MKLYRFMKLSVAILLLAGMIASTGCQAPAASGAPAATSGSGSYNRNPVAAATQAPAQNYEPSEDRNAEGEEEDNGSLNDDGLRYSTKRDRDNSDEEYQDIDEIGFHSPLRFPLSTFSVDPDSAAYSNIRRMINDGDQVPRDAVRIEEMINYFHYDYPEPKGDDPFSVTTEYANCPWNKDHELLLVGIQAEEVSRQELPPSNLIFLLDVSGSMQDNNKLPLVKRAFRMLADRLGSNDTVSIVTYASGVDIVLNGVKGNKKAKIMNAIEDLEAGGSTAGASGLDTAYDVAQDFFIEGGNNRVILATDGDFNVGPSSDTDMIRLIERKRKTGVSLSVLGFGMGNLKDSKLESLAKNGNGNYAYIDDITQARKVMVREMGGTLLTVAKDVKIQIEFNPAEVKGYRLIGYENNMLADEDFANDRVDAGEIGAGHRVTALIEIIPANSSEQVSGSSLKYQTTEHTESGEICTVSIRYKEPEGTKSRLMTIPVADSILTMEPSDNFLFASAVAEFGLLLRDSKYQGDASWRAVINRARKASDDDLKDEFVDLVEMAQDYN